MSRKIRTLVRSWFTDIVKDIGRKGMRLSCCNLLLILYIIWSTLSHSWWKVPHYRHTLAYRCQMQVAFFSPRNFWLSSLTPSVCFHVLAIYLTSAWYIMGSHRCLKCGFSGLNSSGEVGANWSFNPCPFTSRGQQTLSSRLCLLCLMRTRAGTLRTTSTSFVKILRRWNVMTPSFMNQISWAVSRIPHFYQSFLL